MQVDPEDDIHNEWRHGNANRLPSSCSTGHVVSSIELDDALVSIVLPVHNAETHLHDCFEGIVRQSYRPLEVVVCNNGSTDASASILSTWHSRLAEVGIGYACVTTGPEDPKGCGYARNRCIAASKGALSHMRTFCQN
jgi:glycosyltransferase involved in cell wall biosynthesis